ncbi:MAG: hypothetical protein JWM14_65 [Chitinophagaceae bacterium]|nr:hypothetical protein [Chitinophagaceae bacterium]
MKHLRNFFSSNGRLGRIKYLAYCIQLLFLALLIGALGDKQVFTWAILILYILFIIQTIKRLHDLNLSGWWVLLVLVPIVNILVGVWALLKKGTIGKNKYDF